MEFTESIQTVLVETGNVDDGEPSAHLQRRAPGEIVNQQDIRTS